MRIIDRDTNLEVINPDLTIGELSSPTMWASPEAYASIDNVTKFALSNGDYEEVQLYHVWTPEEIKQMEESKIEASKREAIEALPKVVEELSEAVSTGATDTEDLMDAVAELSELVSNLMKSEDTSW